jgi:8-oxo-dGTP diphosphatase
MPGKDNQISSKDIRFAALAVDVVCFRILENKLQVLLGKVISEGNPFKGRWAHIGGLVKADETADQSAERLLSDKAGLKDIYKEQLYTFSEVNRDPRGRVVSVAYIGLVPNAISLRQKDAHAETIWMDIDKVPRLGYDHNRILSLAIIRLKSKIIYTDIARYLMPREFTLSELQSLYEAVLGEKLDKRNFRKKMLSLNVIVDTKKKVKSGVMRPATVYRFQ